MGKFLSLAKLSYFKQSLQTWANNTFVKKVSGKGLSTNDYTNEEKAKLEDLENYVHPDSGATAGTYRSVTVDGKGHVTAGTNPTTLAGYGITDASPKVHTHTSNDIQSLDASKLTGTISLDNLPAGALERCVPVADDAARFALTTAQAQTGDTVKVVSTGLMYFIKDDTKLSSEDGYEPYTAGSASSVPWSGVTGKPSAYPPETHTHFSSEVGLDKVTNDKQMKGLASGTTAGHVMTWGADGYTPADSGFTIGASVPANAKFTDTTYGNFGAATASAAGSAGLVPAPAAGGQDMYLTGAGTWAAIEEITEEDIDALFA